jgi:hypothetical protein
MENVNPGDVLRIAGHCGVVVAVYHSSDAPPVLKVVFVKNAVRQNVAELVDLGVVPDRVVQPATVDDLREEWGTIIDRQQRFVDELIILAGDTECPHHHRRQTNPQ